MKKVFFSLAIAAMGLLMASCDNKTAGNADNTDSTAVLDSGSAQPAGDATAEVNAAENDFVKVSVPKGWESDGTGVTGRKITIKLKPGTDLGEWQYVSIFTNDTATEPDDWKNFAKSCADSYENRTLADDVTFAGVTFKQVKFTNSADVSCMLYGKMPKGTLEITLTEKLTLDNPDVKQILESISFK